MGVTGTVLGAGASGGLLTGEFLSGEDGKGLPVGTLRA